MNRNEFKEFCKKDFIARGFKKQKNAFYLPGDDLLCGIDLQKSYYGEVYYVDYCYFIGDFKNIKKYPTYYESDIQGRIAVMSRKMTNLQGERFLTAQIEYEEYTEEELQPYFDIAFKEEILPPVYQGKKFILDNLGKLYFLSLTPEEVLKKLKS